MRALDMNLVCFAVKEEARFFKAFALQSSTVKILITGMGARNAQQSIQSALAGTRPTMVLTCGFAGGLRAGLTRGTVVFSGAAETDLSRKLITAGAQQVSFHFAERVATTAEEKRSLRERTGADAVEMESKVIRDACAKRNILSATVRVILDPVEEDLPLDFNDVLTADQRIDGFKLARTILKSPGKIPALLRLRQQSAFAAKQLAEVLASVLPTGGSSAQV